MPGILASEPTILRILGNKVMVILGNLTYGIYLIHLIIIHYELATTRTTIPIRYGDILVRSFKISLITIVLAFMVHILVEKSFAKLETKFIFKRNDNKKNENSK
jgi:peptidoglycan/LPS O-acetylase OafA/YrhL